MIQPLTIKQLIDKLNLVMKQFDVSENDYIFFTPVGEDEGDVSVLTPIYNICTPSIQFHDWDEDQLKQIKQNKGIDLCFVKPDIKTL